jgi:hypothetical protein
MGTVGITVIVLLVVVLSLVARGYYLANELKRVNDKLDKVLEQFDGLREYLYEIDPQFDDEREAGRAFENDEHLFAGIDDLQLKERKESEGRRTLNTPLVRW